MTSSRKRGYFPQTYFDCELDLPADSAKIAIHARENRLTLARHVPKPLSTRAYFSPVASARSLRILPEIDTRVQCVAGYYSVSGWLPNYGHGGSPSLTQLTQERGKTMGIVYVYLVEVF